MPDSSTVRWVPHKSLGIPRANMPQVGSEDVPEFLADLVRSGVRVERGVAISAGKLTPAQGEMNLTKARAMAGQRGALKKPIIVSREGFILDGSHRWLAALHAKPGGTYPLRVIRVDLPFRALFIRAHRFSKSYTKKLGEAVRDAVAQFQESYL